MPTSTQLPEGDLAAPATTGQLLLVKSELEGRIDGATAELNSKIDRAVSDLNSKIDHVASDLNSKIDGVRADLQIGLRDLRIEIKGAIIGASRIIWLAVATLGAVGILLRYF